MKRQRGRGRKPGNPANRSYESNGPEVKIRGNASQIYDKYLQLARDATSSGDRVRAENLYQHAEHYYRIVQANQPKRELASEEGEENSEAMGEAVEGEEQSSNPQRDSRRGRGRSRRSSPDDAAEDGTADPLNVVTPEGEASDATEASAPDTEGEEEESTPRRRTRRPRRPRSEKPESEGDESGAKPESSDSESEAA